LHEIFVFSLCLFSVLFLQLLTDHDERDGEATAEVDNEQEGQSVSVLDAEWQVLFVRGKKL
jgi:hypothetical protein